MSDTPKEVDYREEIAAVLKDVCADVENIDYIFTLTIRSDGSTMPRFAGLMAPALVIGALEMAKIGQVALVAGLAESQQYNAQQTIVDEVLP